MEIEFKKWKRNPSQVQKSIYCKCLLDCVIAHKSMMNKSITFITEPAKTDPKSFFRMLSTSRKNSLTLPSNMFFQNVECSSIDMIASAFTTFFHANLTRIARELNNDTLYELYAENYKDDFSYICDEYNHAVSLDEVKKAIEELELEKNPGTSLLSSYLTKNSIEEMTDVLYTIISKIFEYGIEPDCWKEALIIPVPKKGDKKMVTNFRGIAIQNIFAKTFDKVLTAKLYKIFENIIPEFQHGFMRGRSTISNLVEMSSFIIDGLVDGYIVDAIYFDIEKAFDKLDHITLITKLAKISTPFNVVQLLHSIITNRKYSLSINGLKCNNNIVSNCGVPQGSHIGPLLYIVLCYDIRNYVKTAKILQYAVSAKLLVSRHQHLLTHIWLMALLLHHRRTLGIWASYLMRPCLSNPSWQQC